MNPRNKGNSGEREFCKWLYENFNIPMPTRNLEQTRSGGSDIIDVEPFYFEVKRCEQLNLEAWWRQVNKAVKNSGNKKLIPVVCFRQNRKPWEFLISAKNIKMKKGFLRLTEYTFAHWAAPLVSNG